MKGGEEVSTTADVGQAQGLGQQHDVVACTEVVVPRVEPAALRVGRRNMVDERFRRVHHAMARLLHTQCNVSFLPQARSRVVVLDPANLLQHRTPHGHVGTQHVVHVDVASRISGEVAGELPAGEQQSDLADTLSLLTRLSVQRAATHGTNCWILIPGEQLREPIWFCVGVVVKEDHDVAFRGGHSDCPRRRGAAGAAIVSQVADAGDRRDGVPRAGVAGGIHHHDLGGLERLQSQVLKALANVVGTVVGGDDDRGRGFGASAICLSLWCQSHRFVSLSSPRTGLRVLLKPMSLHRYNYARDVTATAGRLRAPLRTQDHDAGRSPQMSRITIASSATAVPMGAQVYQEEIATRAVSALEDVEPGWSVDRVLVRSLRSPLPGNRRLPMGWLARASTRERRNVGRFLYLNRPLVHRMNLELPPPSHVDVVTLHDIVSWKFDDESDPVRAAAEEVRQADAVICVSEFTASEAVEFLGIVDPIVVHNGVDQRFFSATPANPQILADLGVRGPYVLAAGGASERKNLAGLAAAWPKVRSMRPDLTLVLSGPVHPRRTSLFGGMPGVALVGRVHDDVVPGLIAAASAVVVPSLYEGFGLPALEGMAAGVPVVAARTSSLPEVVGDGGILVEPTPDEIAQGLLSAVEGGSDIEEIVAIGRIRSREFTWERSAAGHAKVWTSLV